MLRSRDVSVAPLAKVVLQVSKAGGGGAVAVDDDRAPLDLLELDGGDLVVDQVLGGVAELAELAVALSARPERSLRGDGLAWASLDFWMVSWTACWLASNGCVAPGALGCAGRAGCCGRAGRAGCCGCGGRRAAPAAVLAVAARPCGCGCAGCWGAAVPAAVRPAAAAVPAARVARPPTGPPAPARAALTVTAGVFSTRRSAPIPTATPSSATPTSAPPAAR